MAVILLLASPSRANECDLMAARLVAQQDVTLQERASGIYTFRHPLGAEIDVSCSTWPKARPSINFRWSKPFLTSGELRAMALAGTLYGAPLEDVSSALIKCQEAALRRAPDASAGTKAFTIDCGVTIGDFSHSEFSISPPEGER